LEKLVQNRTTIGSSAAQNRVKREPIKPDKETGVLP
jgi:hypothetical protein